MLHVAAANREPERKNKTNASINKENFQAGIRPRLKPPEVRPPSSLTAASSACVVQIFLHGGKAQGSRIGSSCSRDIQAEQSHVPQTLHVFLYRFFSISYFSSFETGKTQNMQYFMLQFI